MAGHGVVAVGAIGGNRRRNAVRSVNRPNWTGPGFGLEGSCGQDGVCRLECGSADQLSARRTGPGRHARCFAAGTVVVLSPISVCLPHYRGMCQPARSGTPRNVVVRASPGRLTQAAGCRQDGRVPREELLVRRSFDLGVAGQGCRGFGLCGVASVAAAGFSRVITPGLRRLRFLAKRPPGAGSDGT